VGSFWTVTIESPKVIQHMGRLGPREVAVLAGSHTAKGCAPCQLLVPPRPSLPLTLEHPPRPDCRMGASTFQRLLGQQT
jgi:hypothetical protein